MKRNSAKDKIENAYFEMLKTTHYSKIYVSDIIEKAGVSRTTFYRHYIDIFDMHKKIAEGLAFSIAKECLGLILDIRNIGDFYKSFNLVYMKNEEKVLLISGKNGSRYFFEALLMNVENYIKPLRIIFDDEGLFKIRFIAGAMIGFFVKDIIEKRPYSLEHIKVFEEFVNTEILRRKS